MEENDVYVEEAPVSHIMHVMPFVRLNIRQEPSLESEIVGFFDMGTDIEVGEIEEGWAEVEQGFVMAKFLED